MRSLEVIGRLVCAHLHTHSKKITKPRKSKKKKERKLSMFCHSCGLERKSNYRKYLLSGYLFKKSPTLNLS